MNTREEFDRWVKNNPVKTKGFYKSAHRLAFDAWLASEARFAWHPISEDWPLDLGIKIEFVGCVASNDPVIDVIDANKIDYTLRKKGFYTHWRIHRRPE